MGLFVLVIVSLMMMISINSFFEKDGLTDEHFSKQRYDMVERQIISRGVKDGRVLDAMRKIERHKFVPEDLRKEAYGDYPLPIGHGQTISQPYIVALMSELLHLDGDEKVLEVGTGSGYQTAVLSQLAKEVYTLEIIPELASRAREILGDMNCLNVEVIVGDGWEGLPLRGPFDAIIVTAAADSVPRALEDQLAEGGRMVIPIGPRGGIQELVLIRKVDGKCVEKNVTSVRFVPLVREGDPEN